MSQAGSAVWFARHESRLAWRDLVSMMTAGTPSRAAQGRHRLCRLRRLHARRRLFGRRLATPTRRPDRQLLIGITAALLLSWLLMISQAMELLTRAFYARADLDLILASPVAARKTLRGAHRHRGAFGRHHGAAARGAVHRHAGRGAAVRTGSAPMALFPPWARRPRPSRCSLTVALFRLDRPEAHALRRADRRRRHRRRVRHRLAGGGYPVLRHLVADVACCIRMRCCALAARRNSVLVVAGTRRARRRRRACRPCWRCGFAAARAAIADVAPRFGEYAIAAAGADAAPSARARRPSDFRPLRRGSALRRKEWLLLRRDPWLVSQTLMQMLYLVPPALLLWRSFAANPGGALNLLVPVLVMAAGQLAGGLAWLTISGEDAPDLVATAPIPPGFVLRAKIEAVLGVIAAVFAPLDCRARLRFALARADTLAGIVAAAASATAIQLWFRTQAKRSQFRRRQVSSRVATFAEAFSSIGWAATAGDRRGQPSARHGAGVIYLRSPCVARCARYLESARRNRIRGNGPRLPAPDRAAHARSTAISQTCSTRAEHVAGLAADLPPRSSARQSRARSRARSPLPPRGAKPRQRCRMRKPSTAPATAASRAAAACGIRQAFGPRRRQKEHQQRHRRARRGMCADQRCRRRAGSARLASAPTRMRKDRISAQTPIASDAAVAHDRKFFFTGCAAAEPVGGVGQSVFVQRAGHAERCRDGERRRRPGRHADAVRDHIDHRADRRRRRMPASGNAQLGARDFAIRERARAAPAAAACKTGR